jgi:hypothetical protein
MRLMLEALNEVTVGIKEHTLQIDSIMNDIQVKLEESMTNIEHLRESNEVLEAGRKKLLTRLNQLEISSESTEMQQSRIIAENIALQNQLRRIENEEQQARMEVSSIQFSIKEKEDTIFDLTREIRRLTSLKTLQEMRQTSRISPSLYKERKQLENTIRCSVPANQFFPLVSPRYNLRETTASKFTREDSQQEISEVFQDQKERVMKMAEEVRKKARMLEEKDALLKKEMELLQDDYESQVTTLKEQNEELYRLLKHEKLKNNAIRMTITRDSRFSANGTLFDELSKLDMDFDLNNERSFDAIPEEPSFIERLDTYTRESISEVDEDEEYTPRKPILRSSEELKPSYPPKISSIKSSKHSKTAIPPLILSKTPKKSSPVSQLKVFPSIPNLFEDKSVQVELINSEQVTERKIIAKYRTSQHKKKASYKDRCCNSIF